MTSLINSPLSFGAIFLVIQHLPYPRDVSAMMKTCRILHKAGIRSLLRFGATLETEADIVSFCTFVLADVPARAPFVRSIGITIKICIALEEEEDPSDYLSVEGGAAALDSLAQVIRNATNLHALRMDSSDEFLERSPALRDAIAACQNLRCLRLGSIRDMTINLLAAMKSAPSEIELDCIDYKPHRSEPQNLYDVIGKHAETVEKLIVRYADMYQSWEDEAPRFSNIRALALRDCLIVGLVDLHKVFGRQGIEYLEVSGLIPQWEECDEDDIPEMEGAWKDVTHLCGCLDALGGSFKLMHPIKRLDIEGVSSQREQLEQLRTLIGDCRPERYLVHPGYGGLVTKFNVKDVPALLPMPEGASTTRLVLDVALSSVAGSPKMFLVRADLFKAIARQQPLTAEHGVTERLDWTAFQHIDNAFCAQIKRVYGSFFHRCARP